MILSVFCAVLFVNQLVAVSYGYNIKIRGASVDSDDRTYGVIVDCGSSGTRAHIYVWDTNLKYPELLNHIHPLRDQERAPITKKITPGLSSLDDEPEKASEYMQPIIEFITEHIPKSRHPFTGVYILATAGMRLLDEETQAAIMSDIADYLKDNYNFAKVKTSVISGADEGMFQWISVNAKAQRFLKEDTDERTKTYAVIEMGGASTQVTYRLRPGLARSISSLIESSAVDAYMAQIVEPAISRGTGENHYQLHSTTFLGFGSNSARDAYSDLLVKKYRGNSLLNMFCSCNWGQKKEENVMVVSDPCLPRGYMTPEIRKPKSMLSNEQQTIGFVPEEEEELNFSVKFCGQGDHRNCKKRVNEMLMLAKKERLNCKKDELCTMSLIGNNFVPFFRHDFLGIGDIYYTTNIMLNMAGNYDHKSIVKKTKVICETHYQVLVKLYKDIDPRRVAEECFKATWVDTFLIKGLRMREDFDMLETTGSIKGDAPEWTLGAVLDKSLAIEKAVEPEEFEDESPAHSP